MRDTQWNPWNDRWELYRVSGSYWCRSTKMNDSIKALQCAREGMPRHERHCRHSPELSRITTLMKPEKFYFHLHLNIYLSKVWFGKYLLFVRSYRLSFFYSGVSVITSFASWCWRDILSFMYVLEIGMAEGAGSNMPVIISEIYLVYSN